MKKTPRLAWMKHLPDADLRQCVGVELQLMKQVDVAQDLLDAFRKESAAKAKRFCTALEIRKAKNGMA